MPTATTLRTYRDLLEVTRTEAIRKAQAYLSGGCRIHGILQTALDRARQVGVDVSDLPPTTAGAHELLARLQTHNLGEVFPTALLSQEL